MRALGMLLAAALVLAGCTTPGMEFELIADDVPSEATADEAFNFTLRIEGTGEVHSDHIGAHVWTESVADGEATGSLADATACEHQEGDVPGTFNVSCTLGPGEKFVRGHLRYTEDGEQQDLWTEEHMVAVHPSEDQYQLEAQEAPATAEAGEPFEFILAVQGPEATTDHLGAHFWHDGPPQDPTAEVSESVGCAHQETDVPGTYTVSCTADEEGLIFVLGHLRLTIDDGQHDFWAEGFPVEILPES